eukprot:8852891-Pyramimonas_sp.AAC.1
MPRGSRIACRQGRLPVFVLVEMLRPASTAVCACVSALALSAKRPDRCSELRSVIVARRRRERRSGG